MPTYKVYDIKYDLDEEDADVNLPTEMEIYLDKDQDIDYEGADAISDKTGFCVLSFKYQLK